MTGIPSLFLYGLVRFTPVSSPRGFLTFFFIEYRGSSGYGLGIYRSFLYVENLFIHPPRFQSAHSFHDGRRFGYGRSRTRYVSGLSFCVDPFQRFVVPTPPAAVHTSGRLCCQPPRGRLSLRGSAVGLTFSVRLL